MKFDKTGKFISEFARQGKGPNELDNPRLMKMIDGNLYIYERTQGLKVLDSNGQYKKKLRFTRGRYEWFNLAGNTLLYLINQRMPNIPSRIFSFYNVNISSQEITKMIEIIEPKYIR